MRTDGRTATRVGAGTTAGCPPPTAVAPLSSPADAVCGCQAPGCPRAAIHGQSAGVQVGRPAPRSCGQVRPQTSPGAPASGRSLHPTLRQPWFFPLTSPATSKRRILSTDHTCSHRGTCMGTHAHVYTRTHSHGHARTRVHRHTCIHRLAFTRAHAHTHSDLLGQRPHCPLLLGLSGSLLEPVGPQEGASNEGVLAHPGRAMVPLPDRDTQKTHSVNSPQGAPYGAASPLEGTWKARKSSRPPGPSRVGTRVEGEEPSTPSTPRGRDTGPQ